MAPNAVAASRELGQLRLRQEARFADVIGGDEKCPRQPCCSSRRAASSDEAPPSSKVMKTARLGQGMVTRSPMPPRETAPMASRCAANSCGSTLQ